jgi:hypothetical protein
MSLRAARDARRPLIGVAGPCASGKSALVAALRAGGHNAREIAQEHSFAPDMWQRIAAPDLLVLLEVSLQSAQSRASLSDTDVGWWSEQAARLANARAHADLVIQTDRLSPAGVVDIVARFLKRRTEAIPRQALQVSSHEV